MMTHRFVFLGLMIFGFALSAASAKPPTPKPPTPKPAPTIPPAGPGCVDAAVAVIRPCTGPYGTTITVYNKTLKSAPYQLVFRPNFPVLAPLQVIAPKSGFAVGSPTLPAPVELCAYGTKWNVLLITADQKNQGQIGEFTIKCGAGATPTPFVPPAAAPAGAGCKVSAGNAATFPCSGPALTRIGLYPLHALHDTPDLLVFEPLFRYVPMKILAKILTDSKGYYVSAPVELCTYGPTWTITLFGKGGGSLGTVGTFAIDCRGAPTLAPKGGYSKECGPTSMLVSITPCAGPVGTSIKVGTSPILAGKPAVMGFRKAGAPGGPEIMLAIKGSSATATAALCPRGPKFTVSILDSGGIDFGDAGTFTILCAVKGGPPPPPPPPPPPGGKKATPKPSASPSPTPTPKKTARPKMTPTPKPTSTSTPKPQGSPIVFAPRLPNPTPTPTATPSPKPTPTAPQGTCIPAPNSPIRLGTCNLYDTEMVQMTLLGTSPLPPTVVVFQLQGNAVQPLTAPLQPNTNGFTFIVPAGVCRHMPAQWIVFANGPSGQVPIGLFNTNC
jgi:hypothetical protein